MKKIFLITALFLIPFFGISQVRKPIDSFMGITFGSDSDTFKKAMIAKGAHYLPNKPSAGFMAFEHATLFNMKSTVLVEAYFINNKFYQSALVFPNELGPTAITYYYELIKNISQIYGPGEEHNTFAANYQQAKANEINAIQTKKATYMHYWADQNNNKIVITLDASLKVLMVYQNSALAPDN